MKLEEKPMQRSRLSQGARAPNSPRKQSGLHPPQWAQRGSNRGPYSWGSVSTFPSHRATWGTQNFVHLKKPLGQRFCSSRGGSPGKGLPIWGAILQGCSEVGGGVDLPPH